MNKYLAFLVASQLSPASALHCFSCYHLDVPWNYTNFPNNPIPSDPTCNFNSTPDTNLVVNCDEWLNNHSPVSLAPENVFGREKEDSWLVSWKCANFSVDGELTNASDPDLRHFKGMLRTCLPFGNAKKENCSGGKLGDLENQFESEYIKQVIRNVTEFFNFAPTTEVITCTCPDDKCNGEIEDVPEVENAGIIFQTVGHVGYFVLVAFALGSVHFAYN